MKKKTVDIIIPSYHPGEEFKELLEKLKMQDYPVGRILVMNTEQKYWNAEWEKTYPGIEVIHIEKKEFDHGGTRKQAAEISDADVMIYMTQDALPADEHLVSCLMKALENNEDIGAAYARQLPKQDCGYLERFTRSFNYPDKSSVKRQKDLPAYGIKTYFCSNVCAAYDKEIYLKTGGFPERAIFNEDMIYAGHMVKKGYAVAYAADAMVFHSHNYTGRQQFHRNFDLGVSQAEHPEVFEGVPSEGEGIRLVIKSMKYLVSTGHWYQIPGLIFQSGCKYAGYFLGKRYRRLSDSLIRRCTMNKEYWKI